ncbi:hypothetical protein [Thiolapillus sp.]
MMKLLLEGRENTLPDGVRVRDIPEETPRQACGNLRLGLMQRSASLKS